MSGNQEGWTFLSADVDVKKFHPRVPQLSRRWRHTPFGHFRLQTLLVTLVSMPLVGLGLIVLL